MAGDGSGSLHMRGEMKDAGGGKSGGWWNLTEAADLVEERKRVGQQMHAH